MYPDDTARLRHMMDAAGDAAAFMDGKNRADLDADRQLALALIKCIEIVGEAASRVGDQTRARCPEVPWGAIVGMRNRLTHGYYEIDLDRIWDTVRHDIPVLMAALAKAGVPRRT